MLSRFSCLAVLVLLEAVFFSPDAHAYVDPNSAGVLYQVFFPLVVAITLAWRWLKQAATSVLKRLTRRVD
jgi:hypothetical protein